MLLWTSQKIFFDSNHCHAIMDIIKNITDTLNQQQKII